jgi:ATP-binding cassette, subfamily C (CFTR/MRP), member 4
LNIKIDFEYLSFLFHRNWNEQLKKENPSLTNAICKTFWREYLLLGFYQFICDIVVRLIAPIFLGLLLSYFSADSKTSKEQAYIYGAILILLTAIGSIVLNQFMILCFFNGMKVRVATCSLVYRKSLRLSATALGNTSVGKVVNLLSNDVSRFDIVSVFINSMWLAPLLTIIVAILLYNEVGTAGLIGMLVIAVVTPIQSYTGKLTSKFRLQTALRTDERIRLMDEIINGIQVIKFYAWENSFKKLIYNAREKELKVIRKSSYIRALYMTFMLFTTRSALFCTILAMIILKNQITASKVFVISSYFQIISVVMSQMFVRGIAELAECFVVIKRLQSFLEYEEKEIAMIESNKSNIKNHMQNCKSDSDIVIALKNVNCRWKTVEESAEYKLDKLDPLKLKEIEGKMTLSNISIEIKRGILVGVLGPVGSGKSSLLQVLLQELPISSGEMSIHGKLSYATQEPWIFPGSVRQNITFAAELNKKRYDNVIQACALKKDFETFSDADETFIGERGISLSGGQKARLSLARALYRNSDIYILDDVLSAVDSHVAKHLFEKCISSKGFLGKQGATRILVTHQIHFLRNADWLLIIENGKIIRQGHPNDLMNRGLDLIAKITEQKEEQETMRRLSVSSKSSVNSEKQSEQEISNNVHDAKNFKLSNVEESSKGKIKGNVVQNYLKAGGSYFKLGFGIFLFLLTQTIASCFDYFIGYWTHQEETRIYLTSTNFTNQTNLKSDFFTVKNEQILLSSDILIYIGGTLVVLIFLVAIYRSIIFYTITIRASKNLHKVAFNGIISTKMSFFNLNPTGRILNRFSKDLGAIDEWLAKCLLDSFQVILMGIGCIIVTTIINPISLLPAAVLLIIFIYIRRYFLRTSMNLKRLEGITKSQAYVHLASTINGLSTVRAFEAEEILTKEFDNHQVSFSILYNHILVFKI